jgi:hypothetical protein
MSDVKCQLFMLFISRNCHYIYYQPCDSLRCVTAFSPSGANDEPIDAELELDMMQRDPETTNIQHAQSVGIRIL